MIELYHVATELVERIARKNFRGDTLTLKIKFDDFEMKTRSMRFTKELVQLNDILPLAKRLMKQIDYSHHPIRLIGLAVSNPVGETDFFRSPTIDQFQSFLRKYNQEMRPANNITIQAKRYPYFQLNSGMNWKFMPQIPARNVSGMKIVDTTVSRFMMAFIRKSLLEM